MRAARKTAPLCVSLALALALAVSACGSSGGSSSSSATTAAPTGTQASSAAPAHTASAARLSILAPRSGTHTGPTLTVRVALSGAPSTAGQQFRYVLDGHVNRSGPSRLTFHDLAPGHHRLEVLTAGSAVHANATFTVRAPLAAPVTHTSAPASSPKGEPVQTTAPGEPAHTTPPAASSPGGKPVHTKAPKAPAPKPAPTATTPAPAPAKTAPSTSSEGIPQGPNAGDGDGDNNGEPSDGDGNL